MKNPLPPENRIVFQIHENKSGKSLISKNSLTGSGSSPNR